tara:strand:+ start:1143 stop:1964 length:822 start_codon:yes stop_codon:yes gene_type:complete
MKAVCVKDIDAAIQQVEGLLHAGEDPNQIDVACNSVPLLEAWSSGNIGVIQALIYAGADGKIVAKLPYDLTWSFAYNDLEATMLIIKSGFTLDHLYSSNEQGERMCGWDNLLANLLTDNLSEHIKQLMPYGIMEFLHAFDCVGDAPLGCMARDGHIEQSEWLLSQHADVNLQCESLNGNTALDRAIESNDVAMTKLLLSAGANPNIPTSMWITATDRAVNFKSDIEFRKKESRNVARSIEIRDMILEASASFPHPTYPNGKRPSQWPPEPKDR